MPGFSPNRGLTVPTVGGDTNTWGNELDTSLNLLDTILGGHVSISVASSNVTLTSGQLGNAVIKLSGTLTGSISLIFPQSGGGYWVVDASAVVFGAHAITATTSGGSTVLLGPGATPIYSDGTNIVQCLAAPSGLLSLDVSGAGSTFVLTSSQAQNIAIKYSGTLTGNATIQFPGIRGLYVLLNGLGSDTFGVAITSAGGGTSIAAAVLAHGKAMTIYTDGTNIYQISAPNTF